MKDITVGYFTKSVRLPDHFSEADRELREVSKKLGGRYVVKVIYDEDYEEAYSVSIYTELCRYDITLGAAYDGDSYIGAIAYTKGDSGNDLEDGDYSKDTIDEIVNDILTYEESLRTGRQSGRWIPR